MLVSRVGSTQPNDAAAMFLKHMKGGAKHAPLIPLEGWVTYIQKQGLLNGMPNLLLGEVEPEIAQHQYTDLAGGLKAEAGKPDPRGAALSQKGNLSSPNKPG